MRVNSGIYNRTSLFQHEASHLFFCSDHHDPLPPAPPTSPICLMSGRCHFQNITYCGECVDRLWLNRARFDITSYTIGTISTTVGGGRVYDEDRVKKDFLDRSYAYLKSGNIVNDGATINTLMSTTPISGQFYVRCYSDGPAGGVMKVFVKNAYGVWTEIKFTNIYTPNGQSDSYCYDVGYVTSIVEAAIVAYCYNSTYPSQLYVDAVFVA